jgi:hypothetical protein
MRFTTAQYLEKEAITISVHNVSANSKVWLDGQVVFAISYDQLVTNSGATPPTSLLQSLGVDALIASDAAGSTTNSGTFALGVVKVNPSTTNVSTTNVAQVGVGGVSEAVCYGFTDAIIQVRTRAASTDVWATVAGAAGDQLIPETVNNCLKWSGTVPLQGPRVQFALAQALGSLGSISYASGTLNPNAASTATVETARLKVRVCCM